MNDTHGEQGEGWYGFDLDGTLAKYDGWKGIDHIGEPVKPMVELMKRMHDEGKVVKIMTARVAPRRLEDGTFGEQFTWLTPEPSPDPAAKYTATQYIQDWCEESAQLGFVPEIVYQKDHLMLELYDDRVEVVDVKWWSRLNWFFFGAVLMTALLVVFQAIFGREKPLPEATENLDRAIHEFMESQRREGPVKE